MTTREILIIRLLGLADSVRLGQDAHKACTLVSKDRQEQELGLASSENGTGKK